MYSGHSSGHMTRSCQEICIIKIHYFDRIKSNKIIHINLRSLCSNPRDKSKIKKTKCRLYRMLTLNISVLNN
jgi:hypothetical protein